MYYLRNMLRLTTIMMLLLMTACSGSDSDDEQGVEFIVNKTSISFSNTGGSESINIQASQKPAITASDSWLSVGEITAQGTKGIIYVVSITAEANSDTSVRTANIAISVNGSTKTIAVTQEAGVKVIPATIEKDKTGMDKDAKQIAASIYAGWNIGNTLEATGGENAWGNPNITEALIKSIKAAGFTAIRLPVAWDGHLDDRATYKINEAWMARVNEVVDWCVKNELYVIVNIHWDGGWLENNCTEDKKAANIKEQDALWRQIAIQFRDYDQHVLFAGCNEPNASTAEKMAVLKEYEQTFVDAVRNTGGRNYYRTLIIQGPDTDIDETVSLFGSMPTDVVENRMMAEVHYYTPWQFCGLEEDAGWGKMFYFWGDGNHVADSNRNADWGELTDMKTQFQKMKTMFVDKGIPVILGEYGAIDRSASITDATQLAAHKQSRRDFYKIVTREAKNYGLAPFVWDTGEGIDRATAAISGDIIVPSVIEGAQAGTYPY
jgi:aryl-phospho-beta-D-glucosidase BglC (GH1 family)